MFAFIDRGNFKRGESPRVSKLVKTESLRCKHNSHKVCSVWVDRCNTATQKVGRC